MEAKLVGATRLDMQEVFRANRDSQTCIKATFDTYWATYKAAIVENQVKHGIDRARAVESMETLRAPVYAGFMAGVSIVQSVARTALGGNIEAQLDALAIFAEYDATTSTYYAQVAVNKMQAAG